MFVFVCVGGGGGSGFVHECVRVYVGIAWKNYYTGTDLAAKEHVGGTLIPLSLSPFVIHLPFSPPPDTPTKGSATKLWENKKE